MNIDTIFNDLVKEFDLTDLQQEDQEKLLAEIALAIQTQFLLDIQNKIGEEQFQALEHSLAMGEAFYETTLKHVLPTYEELFQTSRKKVVDAYKAATTPVLN